MPTTEPDTAALALRVYTFTQHRLRTAVKDGRMDPRTGAAHLRPWLAIACRVGADLPELAEGLADRRVTQLDAGSGPDITEGEARALLSDEICPRSHWAPLLTRSRNSALAGSCATQDQRDNANALAELARHLAIDPNGRHDIPPPPWPYAEGRAAA